jgi:membrane-associated phospholipid phosphatase
MFYYLVVLICIHPYSFGVRHITDKRAMVLLMGVFAATVVLPGFGIMLLKPLGFMQSYQSPSKQERIGPYIILGIMYVWVYKSLTADLGFPLTYANVFLGATIALFIGFFLNNWIKVSAHMNGVGGFLGAVLITALSFYPGATLPIELNGMTLQISMSALVIFSVILAAATAYARLALKAHNWQEVILGFLIGFISQFVVWVYNY